MAEEKVKYHQSYIDGKDTWELVDNFVDGRIKNVKKYLIPYPSERLTTDDAIKSFLGRTERLQNKNLCKPILDIHLSHLSQGITWGNIDSNPKLNPIIIDATGFRIPAKRMVRNFLYEFIKLGRAGMLVDAPKSANAESELQEQILNQKSYEVVYSAAEIYNFEYFTEGLRRGKLKQIYLKEPPRIDEKGDSFDRIRKFSIEENESVFTVTILERKPTTNKDGMWQVIEQFPGTLEEIPFVMIGDGAPDSVLKDVAHLNMINLNKQSTKDNIMYYQEHQRVMGTGIKPEELAVWNERTVATVSNENARLHVVNAGSTDNLTDDIANNEERATKIGLFQLNQLAEDTRQVQSAESKQKDMVARRKFYDDTLDLIEETFNEIFRFHALFEGVGSIESNIKIAREYGLDDPEEERADNLVINSIASQLGVLDLQKEILRRLIIRRGAIGEPGDTPEDAAAKLLEAINKAQPQQLFSGSFGTNTLTTPSDNSLFSSLTTETKT
jgi:hypothetical protein